MKMTLDKGSCDWFLDNNYFMCAAGFSQIFGTHFDSAPKKITLSYSTEPKTVNSIIVKISRDCGEFTISSRFGEIISRDFYYGLDRALANLVEDGESKYFFVNIA